MTQFRVWWHNDNLRKYVVIIKFKISLINCFCPNLGIVDLCPWGLYLKNFLFYHCEWHCIFFLFFLFFNIKCPSRERKQWKAESVRMTLQSSDPVPHVRLMVLQQNYEWVFQGYLWPAETSNKCVFCCLQSSVRNFH